MAAVDPAIRTVHLTKIPGWVRENPDTAFVVPGITRSIEMAVAPTKFVSYQYESFDTIRVEFLSHDSAREAMLHYNSRQHASKEFTLIWSNYNLEPPDSPPPNQARRPVARCPVVYRFPQRDIQAVVAPNDRTPPEPVHPSDPRWFCRYNPYQREIQRQVQYMWSAPAQSPQNNMWVPPPEVYMWVPQPHHHGPPPVPQPHQMGPPPVPQPHPMGLPPQHPNWWQHPHGHHPVMQQPVQPYQQHRFAPHPLQQRPQAPWLHQGLP